MKTKEELNALKNEVEALNKKLAELNEEELAQVTGGRKYEDQEVQEDIRLWPDGDPRFRNLCTSSSPKAPHSDENAKVIL